MGTIQIFGREHRNLLKASSVYTLESNATGSVGEDEAAIVDERIRLEEAGERNGGAAVD